MRYFTDEQKYSFESDSESGKDFSAGSEDNYVPPQKPSSPSPSPSPPPKGRKNKSLRGINAHRAAVHARNSKWNVQPLTTDAPNVLFSDRGRSRGRVRIERVVSGVAVKIDVNPELKCWLQTDN